MHWLKSWQWFHKADTLQLFLYMLVNANTEDGYWQGILVKRGQIIVTIPTLAELLDSTPKKIRNNLERLSISHEIGRQTTNKYSIVTICNYDSYIGNKIVVGQSKGSQRAVKGQSIKETNKENISPTPPIKENKKENSPSLHLTVEPPPSKIYREVVELWDKICTSSPRLRAHSQARQNKVLCRVKEMGGYPKAIATITEMFTVVQSNSFYTGDNSRGWVAGFDWFFENSTNWCKVIERVHNSKSNGQKHNSTSKAEHIASERERIMREVASAAPRECDAPSWLE